MSFCYKSIRRDTTGSSCNLASGFTDAVAETGKVDTKTIDAWRRVVRTGAVVGHTDTLATPA